MTHFLVSCALSLLALLAAYFTFRRWQKNKSIWYVISIVASVLAVPAFWLSWVHGFFLLVPAALLFVLGELFKKR
jgi:L-lactate permease